MRMGAPHLLHRRRCAQADAGPGSGDGRGAWRAPDGRYAPSKGDTPPGHALRRQHRPLRGPQAEVSRCGARDRWRAQLLPNPMQEELQWQLLPMLQVGSRPALRRARSGAACRAAPRRSALTDSPATGTVCKRVLTLNKAPLHPGVSTAPVLTLPAGGGVDRLTQTHRGCARKILPTGNSSLGGNS